MERGLWRRLVSLVIAATLSTFSMASPGHASPFFIEEFSITRDGSLLFLDPFEDNAPPPSAPDLEVGFPISYTVAGILSESGGVVRLDEAGALQTSPPVSNAFGGASVVLVELAQLNTNIDPLSPLGLKQGVTFSVTGLFDLGLPERNFEIYGIRLFDGGSTQPLNDFLRLVVRREADSQVRVVFDRVDFSTGAYTQFDKVDLDPLHDQIALTLTRGDTANDAVTASFAYVDGGTKGPVTTFGATADIFRGENFTTGGFLFVTPIPEPGTVTLFGSGLAALAARRRLRTGRRTPGGAASGVPAASDSKDRFSYPWKRDPR